jgi:hypothetical protein
MWSRGVFYRYPAIESARTVESNRVRSCRAAGCCSIVHGDDPFCLRCRQEIDALREMTSRPLGLVGRTWWKRIART